MSEYEAIVRSSRKWMYILLVCLVVLAIALPDYQTFLYGLLIGSVVSFYNMWLLQRRTELLGESAAKDGKRKGIGTISRLAAAALGVLIAIRYDLSVVGYIIGLMTAYPVIIIQFILKNR